MKNYKVRRVLSYFIDFLIVSLLISLLSSIKVLNPKYNEYREAYAEYREVFEETINGEDLNYKIDAKTEKLMYDISYYGISYTIIEIGVIVLYFTLFPTFFGGQTIGKKITRLKVVSNNDDEKVSFITFLLRSFIYPIFSTGLFYCSVSLLGNLLGLVIFKQAHFLSINKAFLIIGLIWGYADTIVCLARGDNKSLHDLLLKTQVVETNN